MSGCLEGQVVGEGAGARGTGSCGEGEGSGARGTGFGEEGGGELEGQVVWERVRGTGSWGGG